MTWMKSWSRLPGFLGIGLVLGLQSGCQTPDGQRWWPLGPRPELPYQAYRPTYAIPNTKPLYLSNYAGDDHSPMRPRRRTSTNAAPIAGDAPVGVTVDHGSWDSE
ncbi:MAG: hypothetical protein ACLQGP_10110 [Isosphaeraceae bacterium]